MSIDLTHGRAIGGDRFECDILLTDSLHLGALKVGVLYILIYRNSALYMQDYAL
jgi:hypothetical protein